MMEYKDMTCKDAIKYIPTRILNMISKLIGMRGVALVTTIYLFKGKYIPDAMIAYVWMFTILIVVFGDKALEAFKDIKK